MNKWYLNYYFVIRNLKNHPLKPVIGILNNHFEYPIHTHESNPVQTVNKFVT